MVRAGIAVLLLVAVGVLVYVLLPDEPPFQPAEEDREEDSFIVANQSVDEFDELHEEPPPAVARSRPIVGVVRRGGKPCRARLTLARGATEFSWLTDLRSSDDFRYVGEAGEDGRFRIEVAIGHHMLRATAEDGAAAAIEVHAEGKGHPDHFIVEIPVGAHVLRGRAVHADGRPFRGTVGAVLGDREPPVHLPSVRPDPEGRFLLRALPPGAIRILARLPEVPRGREPGLARAPGGRGRLRGRRGAHADRGTGGDRGRAADTRRRRARVRPWGLRRPRPAAHPALPRRHGRPGGLPHLPRAHRHGRGGRVHLASLAPGSRGRGARHPAPTVADPPRKSRRRRDGRARRRRAGPGARRPGAHLDGRRVHVRPGPSGSPDPLRPSAEGGRRSSCARTRTCRSTRCGSSRDRGRRRRWSSARSARGSCGDASWDRTASRFAARACCGDPCGRPPGSIGAPGGRRAAPTGATSRSRGGTERSSCGT
jgi:hypothetical protein